MKVLLAPTDGRLYGPAQLIVTPQHIGRQGWSLPCQPQSFRWPLFVQMHSDPEHTEGSVSSLAGVKVFPVLNLDLAPSGVRELQALLRLCPTLGLFEGEALSMDIRSAPTLVGRWLAIEHTVTTQAHQHSTGQMAQGAQKPMVAIAAVAHDDIEAASLFT